MSREKILSLLLEQGDSYVSGEAMSRTLGISRAAVWKAMESLRDEGYVISSPDRGFPSRAFNSASTSSRSIRSTSFRPLLYPSPPKSSTYISF